MAERGPRERSARWGESGVVVMGRQRWSAGVAEALGQASAMELWDGGCESGNGIRRHIVRYSGDCRGHRKKEQEFKGLV